MNFSERSYGGNIFRPRPEIEFSDADQFLCITTPWGARDSAEKLNHSIRDRFLSARSDKESTSPFDRLTCISGIANDLRISMKLANDILYAENNREDYTSGAELLALASDGDEVVWGQLGLPAVYLDRPNSPLIPLTNSADLATELSSANLKLAPLPSKLIGIDTHTDFEMHSIKPRTGEGLIFLSRSFVPAGFFDLAYGSRGTEEISKVCSQDDPDLPFWVGRLDF